MMSVSLSEIEAHLAELPKPPAKSEKAPAKANTDGYAERKGRALLHSAKWDHYGEGEGRNQAAFRHSADLRRDFDLAEADAWEIIRQWNDGNRPPLGEQELRQAFNAGLKYGKHEPGSKLNQKKRGKPATQDATAKPRLEGVILRVQRDEMRAVRWLVVGHIACGKLTILVGLPGAGKSLFVIWLVAAMQGKGWLPALAPGVPVEILRGEALLVTCEDDPYDTISLRLAAYGVDPSTMPIYMGTRIVEPDGSVVVSLFDLSLHLPAIERFLAENPSTRLLIIDPVQTFLGQTDLNGNTQVNVALGALAELAQRRGVAVILVSHFNKKGDQAALDRIIGSRGFSGTVRAAWQVTGDREQKNRCILACTKQQNGPKPDAMAYRIRGVPMQVEGLMQSVPIIEFEPDRIDVDPDELVKPKSEKPQTAECTAWLKERLAAGAVLSSTIFEEGAAKGFSRNVCYGAKDRLRLNKTKAGFQGQWFWKLPENGDSHQ